MMMMIEAQHIGFTVVAEGWRRQGCTVPIHVNGCSMAILCYEARYVGFPVVAEDWEGLGSSVP